MTTNEREHKRTQELLRATESSLRPRVYLRLALEIAHEHREGRLPLADAVDRLFVGHAHDEIALATPPTEEAFAANEILHLATILDAPESMTQASGEVWDRIEQLARSHLRA